MKEKLRLLLEIIQNRLRTLLTYFFALNAIIVLFQVIYLSLRMQYVNSVIPFWYSLTWGEAQLGNKNLLWLLPVLSFLITVFGVLFIVVLNRYFVRYINEIIFISATGANLFITYSLFRIILSDSAHFEPLINPNMLILGIAFFVAFVCVHLVTPYFINIYKNFGIVTNPQMHEHPGMSLQAPSTRGGGAIFSLIFIILAVLLKLFPPWETTKEIES